MELEDVRENYDRLAKHYDLGTDIIFGRLLGIERLRERTIAHLGDIRGKRVLDIGCGTGRNFRVLRSRVGPDGHIVGLDYSKGMLDQARSLITREGWHNIELVEGDAAKLDGIDGMFDAVVSIWCMGIVHDLEAALHRAVDVLRPGGRIAIMDFERARPDHGPLRWLYPIYSALLRWAGVDSAADLDDARLQAKWGRGRTVLRSRLQQMQDERYLSGAGIIVWGTTADRDAARPSRELRP